MGTSPWGTTPSVANQLGRLGDRSKPGLDLINCVHQREQSVKACTKHMKWTELKWNALIFQLVRFVHALSITASRQLSKQTKWRTPLTKNWSNRWWRSGVASDIIISRSMTCQNTKIDQYHYTMYTYCKVLHGP